MKKYGLRVLVGLIAFAIGVSVVIRNLNQPEICYVSLKETKQPEISIYPTSPNGKIEVRFVGYGRIENRPTLKFLIVNNSSNLVKYWAFEKGEIPLTVRFKKEIVKSIHGLACGIKDEFSIKPKEQIDLEIFADLLTFDSLTKNGNFEFGFTFYNLENLSLEYWSKPIAISEMMKKDILKNAPDFFYKTKKEKLQIMSPKQVAAFNDYK